MVRDGPGPDHSGIRHDAAVVVPPGDQAFEDQPSPGITAPVLDELRDLEGVAYPLAQERPLETASPCFCHVLLLLCCPALL
jgi:hypothetical protein